jgi:hypothetical protein
LWAITMADDTPVDTCRSRSRSCAAPAPDGRHARSGSRGRPRARQDGRQRLAGPQRRGAQHHRRPNLRGCQVGRQDFGGSPAPRRQGPVGIGKAGLVPAGLGMAEQPEALHSGASVVAVRVPRSLGMAQSGLTRDVVVVVVLTGFPGRLGSWQQGAVQGGIVPLDDWRCADGFGGGPMASRADSRVDPLL